MPGSPTASCQTPELFDVRIAPGSRPSPGVVNQDVKSSPSRMDGFERGLDLSFVADVGAYRQRAIRTDFVDQHPRCISISDIVHGNVGACAAQRPDYRRTDAAAAPG